MLGFALFPFFSWTPLRCPALRAVQAATFSLLTGTVDACLVPRELRVKLADRYFLHPLDQGSLQPCSIWEAWSGQAVRLCSLCFPDLLPLPQSLLQMGRAGQDGSFVHLEHEIAAKKWVCPDRLDLAWCHAKSSQPIGLPATGGFLTEVEFAVLLLAVIR